METPLRERCHGEGPVPGDAVTVEERNVAEAFRQAGQPRTDSGPGTDSSAPLGDGGHADQCPKGTLTVNAGAEEPSFVLNAIPPERPCSTVKGECAARARGVLAWHLLHGL